MESEKGVKTEIRKSSNFIEKQTYFNINDREKNNLDNSMQSNKNQNSYFNKLDSYTIQMMIYNAEMYILMRYPYLADINTSEDSKMFIIKSFYEEDVHKAIKYNLWTSSKKGLNIINEAYLNTKGKVLLLFSSNQSGRFLGLAQMKSQVEYNKYFPYWTQDYRGGIFEIEWIFIKDLPNALFKEIKFKFSDDIIRPINYCHNAQELPYDIAKKSLEIIENYYNTNTILEHFEYYDIRQENYEKMFPIQNQYN